MNNNFLPYQLKKNADQNSTMANEIGTLSNLTTSDKSSLVNAINSNVTSLAQNVSNINTQRINMLYPPTGLTACKGDGTVTNEEVAINAALSANKEVYLPDGTYKISNTITVPSGKKLIMEKGTNIVPQGNFDVFLGYSHSYIEGGYVDLTGVTGFSKGVIKTSTGITDNFKVYRLKAKNNTTTPSGKGFDFDCTTDANKILMFSRFIDVYFEGFQYGVYIKSLLTNPNFANNNFFSGVISYCPYVVWNENADGNTYDFMGESANTNNGESTFYINGHYNLIRGFIFDVGLAGHSPIYIEFDGYNNKMETIVSSKMIIDHQQGKNSYSQKQMHLPPTKGTTDYAGNSGTYFIGDQSNFLVSAHKRFTITETFTNTANWSSNTYPFLTTGSSPLTYNFTTPSSTTDNAQMLINMTSAYYLRLLGISFAQNGQPKHFKLEVYSTYDNAWHGKDFYPTDAGAFIWDINNDLGYSICNVITQIRITVYQPNTGSNVNITNIFAHSPSGGNAFLPTHGGTLYGDTDFNKNKAKNMVLDSGATASRPASPVVGQVFYDTTLGKPIYCKVGGASPTWTDATGTTV